MGGRCKEAGMAYATRHRRLMVLIALALLAPLGTAIGSAAAQESTVTMWFDTTGGAETADCVVKNAIDPFNDLGGPQVEATLQANNWDATRTALAGGAGPDVVGTPGPSFAVELAKAGQLLPLDQFAQSEGWAESFVPWALDLGKVNGQLYSMPGEVETLVLYYNKTLFEEKGYALPKTMDELMALAEQIEADGLIPFGHGNAEWRPANEWFVGEFLNHIAGPDRVYQALTGEIRWDDPAFVQAIDALTTMQQNGWFMGGLDRYYTATFDDFHAAFGDGKAAMNIEGTWFMQDVTQYFGEEAGNENDWGWVPMPSTDGRPVYDLGIGSTLSINKNAKDPAAVAKYLTHLYSPAIQAALLTECGLAPAPVDIPADLLTGLDQRHAQIVGDLNRASTENDYGYTTWTFWPPKAETYLIENIEKVWAGDMTSQEYLAGMQQIFDEERAAGDVPPLPTR